MFSPTLNMRVTGVYPTQYPLLYIAEYANSRAAKTPVMHEVSHGLSLQNFAITMKTGNASKIYLVMDRNFTIGPPVSVRYGRIRTPSANRKSDEGNHFR